MVDQIYISAGEISGDLHGGGLAKELKKLNPDLHISGMGAHNMQESGVKLFRDCRDYSIMGFFGVFSNIFRFRKLLKDVAEHIKTNDIKTVVLIDYSGFNLRLAKAIKPSGVKILYFVSPQVWAWRTGRVKAVEKYVKRMITIFPFETSFYRDYGIDVDYVGHPMLDNIEPLSIDQRLEKSKKFKQRYNLNTASPVLALLPGSRRQEIERMLPTMLETAKLLKAKIADLNVVIASAPNAGFEKFKLMQLFQSVNPLIVKNDTSNVLYSADAVLTSSGTATIETALHGTPQVVMYKTGYLTYRIAKSLVKVDYISMANLVAREEAVPEFVQNDANPASLIKELEPLLTCSDKWQSAHLKALKIREMLGEKGAYRKAALIVEDELKSC